MTLLTICEGLALNVGLEVPTAVVTSSLREWDEAVQFANEAGEELARRVDWGVLHSTATLTGDGTNKVHTLTGSRLDAGVTVKTSTGYVRPLTQAEWNTLTAVSGTPRYFLKQGNSVTLWPYLANAATVTASYISKSWASSGATFLADTDTALIDEGLLLKGLIVRWRRQKGMSYADEEAEYEAALAQFADFDGRSRI